MKIDLKELTHIFELAKKVRHHLEKDGELGQYGLNELHSLLYEIEILNKIWESEH